MAGQAWQRHMKSDQMALQWVSESPRGMARTRGLKKAASQGEKSLMNAEACPGGGG